ncbi:HECT-domain-containing protein [Catenaria anguillulae PL171]|uniref:HECT-type E3 ubiquitin transferase n=1 Tax=Catenaria anguillulae PL171 TaxID=765915 RepID=A0A1Y2I1X1_9FUNG|nr:HECT-domain-containing protein [Catenaria anguillulae PL171]
MSPRHRILRDIPFVLPFADRVHLFRTFIQLDKDALGYGAERDIILTERQRLTVRRDHVFEDGFKQLSKLGGTLLRSRLAISFISELGLDEAGVDGGGVWKEFFSLLSKEAFHPDSGLFLTTDHDHALYPNPAATSPLDLRKFEFVGRVVGKALYDGLLVGAAFAPFFINHWLQRSNLFDDLPSLDPELYKHLVYLKNMPAGEVEELGVTFTVDVKDRGQTRTLELMRGGAHTPVTSANRIKYTYLVANFKLNHLIQRQCRAFLSGLSDLIRPEWLQLFNQTELLHLVSGSDEPIDIADMRAHTIYGGEYSAGHRVIRNFWQVAEELGTEDRRLLLRFITSSTRAPLLGFKELVPALCIRPGGDDQEWLPTASTCVNLLKLPVYRDLGTLREKLLYSIRSGVGFELS